MNIVIDLSDIIAIGVLIVGAVVWGMAYLYQEYWFKPRHRYDCTKGKWVRK